jgi:hypothetical protein
MSKIASTEQLSERPAVGRRMRSSELISLDVVRNRLGMVWAIGASLPVILVVFQSLIGRFGGRDQDAWAWLLPTIMPTLGMIITVLGYTALDPVRSKAVVRKTFFYFALWFSIAYLTLVTMAVVIGPFVAATGAGMIDVMHKSNLWLGPCQALVASALGVLFVTKQKQDADGSE